MEMCSTRIERKFVVAETFIRTLMNKTYKKITAVLEKCISNDFFIYK